MDEVISGDRATLGLDSAQAYKLKRKEKGRKERKEKKVLVPVESGEADDDYHLGRHKGGVMLSVYMAALVASTSSFCMTDSETTNPTISEILDVRRPSQRDEGVELRVARVDFQLSVKTSNWKLAAEMRTVGGLFEYRLRVPISFARQGQIVLKTFSWGKACR